MQYRHVRGSLWLKGCCESAARQVFWVRSRKDLCVENIELEIGYHRELWKVRSMHTVYASWDVQSTLDSENWHFNSNFQSIAWASNQRCWKSHIFPYWGSCWWLPPRESTSSTKYLRTLLNMKVSVVVAWFCKVVVQVEWLCKPYAFLTLSFASRNLQGYKARRREFVPYMPIRAATSTGFISIQSSWQFPLANFVGFSISKVPDFIPFVWDCQSSLSM